MVKQKRNRSKIIKYTKILFLLIWIYSIFIGGKLMFLLVTIWGLYMAIDFKQVGRDAIEQRKKWNRILPFPQSEKDFGEPTIIIHQFLFLVAGIVIFILGLANLIK